MYQYGHTKRRYRLYDQWSTKWLKCVCKTYVKILEKVVSERFLFQQQWYTLTYTCVKIHCDLMKKVYKIWFHSKK